MNEEKRSHYDVLGVGKTASLDEIRVKYRAKVMETHPDRTVGKEDEFRRAAEAFKVLSDSSLREEYDLSREEKTKLDPTTFEVPDSEHIKTIIGVAKTKPVSPSGPVLTSQRQDDDRLYFREQMKWRYRAPESEAEFKQRLQARAKPVVKIGPGAGLRFVLGGVLLSLGAIYAVTR